MKKRAGFLNFFVIVFGAAAFATAAFAAPSYQDFIRNATIGGRFEIASSRLALQNSQDDDVKQFAQQMIDDHTQIDDRLKAVISASNVEPKQPDAGIDQKHQKILDKLGKLSGPAFDKEYVKEQLKSHDDAVSLFRDYARNGDNDNLKTFAKETLPKLQEHQQYIDKLKDSF